MYPFMIRAENPTDDGKVVLSVAEGPRMWWWCCGVRWGGAPPANCGEFPEHDPKWTDHKDPLYDEPHMLQETLLRWNYCTLIVFFVGMVWGGVKLRRLSPCACVCARVCVWGGVLYLFVSAPPLPR